MLLAIYNGWTFYVYEKKRFAIKDTHFYRNKKLHSSIWDEDNFI